MTEAGGSRPVPRSIRVDLHNHTYYSPDSILSPERLVSECRRRAIDVLAVTDHNTIRGALAVREVADFPLIIGEEIRSADGEIIGLFLRDEVPRGRPGAETVARVKEQGGLAGIPHPFDPRRLALRGEKLLEVIDQIDFIEALNARIVFGAYNKRAAAFADERRIAKSAGSDAHSPGEVGRAWAEVRPFDGPADFLKALREGRLAGTLSSPLVHLVSRYAAIRRRLGWRPPA